MFKLHRYWIALLSSIITNSYFYSLIKKTIYTGNFKYFCSPGLNCYSCPLSIFSCPIGIIQHISASVRVNLSLKKYLLGFYTFGLLGFFGIIGGRFICGWLCPFGFLQELIYKIPSRKIYYYGGVLRYLKYLILIIVVILLPAIIVDKFKLGEPFFCKFFCPAGTLEAGIPLPIMIKSLKKLIGFNYFFKLFILIIFIFGFIFIKRPFCRFFCPLGAIYSIFNKISFVQLKRNENKCVRCLKCVNSCPMGLKLEEICNNLNCIKCFECKKNCKFGAISSRFGG